MRAIRDNTVIQIEITNACHLSCQNCTRHVGHHRKPFFMSLEEIENAIRCTLDSPCRIGIMGGEPALHPQFGEVLALVRDTIPEDRREFWTAGFRWEDRADDIRATFPKERIHYNDHVAYDGKHAPLLVAINEVVDDEELKRELIDNCPYQTHWSASITPKGGFFCEIAASLDWLLDGPGGYDIEPGWWDRDPEDFRDQVDRYCGNCSGAIPQPPLPVMSDARGGRDASNRDLISPGMLEKLRALGSVKVAKGGYDVWHGRITRDDIPAERRNPRAYRSFEAHDPEDVEKARA